MKVKLIKQFKNHPSGSVLDVSQGVYNYLLSLGCIRDPKDSEPVEFAPDLIKAAKDLKPKRPNIKKKTKALKKPPADRMVKEEETKEIILDEGG